MAYKRLMNFLLTPNVALDHSNLRTCSVDMYVSGREERKS